MARISRQDVDYIIDNIDIVSLVSEYVKLEKRGRNYVGLCPFHNEDTPSFSVSPEKKIAHCFGCGKGGDIFQFLSLVDNITYKQAISKLGSRLGLSLESEEENKEITYNLEVDVDIMYYAHLLVADYYNYILLNTKEAEDALNYLLERGLTKDVIKHFNIGYAPKDNIALNFFKSKNLSLDIMVEAGLLGRGEQGYYDVFKDRIMFPIKNNQNQVVAFSGRTMSTDKQVAKYYNTHETKIFEKRKVLYNFSDARQFIAKDKEIILCEGYMDVIKAHQNNIKNAVALMGTNIDKDKISELLSLVDKVTLCLDNDEAGSKAQVAIGNSFFKQIDNIYKLTFSGTKDLDEYLTVRSQDSNFNIENFLLNNKQHFIDFKIMYCDEIAQNNIEQKINFKNELLGDIATVKDESLKYILLSHLAEVFKIDVNILSRELSQINVTTKKNSTNNEWQVPTDRRVIFSNSQYDKKICRLFKYFFKDRLLFIENYEEVEQCSFNNSFLKLLDYLIIYYNNNLEFYIYKFIQNIEDEEIRRLAIYIDETDFVIENQPTIDIVADYITYLKKDKLNIDELRELVKIAVREADEESQIKLLEQLKKYKK